MIEIQLLDQNLNLKDINALLKELSPNTESLKDLTRYYKADSTFIFIALDSSDKYSKIIGMATLFFVWKCSGWMAEIHDVVVDPDYRGRHIGDMLMIKLLETVNNAVAKIKQKIPVYLTSKPRRIAANNMYLKHGFKIVARAEGKEGTNLYKLVLKPRT